MAVFFGLYTYLGTLGIEQKWFGLIIGAFSFVSLVVRPFITPFLHPGNARACMSLGCAMLIAALFSYGFTQTLTGLLLVRVFHGLGHVFLMTAFTALIMVFIPQGQSQNAFGFMMNINLLPYAVIPPLLGVVMNSPADFPQVLYVVALAMFLFFPLLWLTKPGNGVSPVKNASQRASLQVVWQNLKSREVVILLLIQFCIFLGYAPVFYFIKAFAEQKGLARAGLFFSFVTLSMFVSRILVLPFCDKMGKKRVFAAALGLLTLCLPLLGRVEGQLMFFGLALFLGAGWGLASPLVTSIMFESSSPELRGVNTNFLMEMQQAGFFVGPFLGGLVVASWGLEILFDLCGLLTLVAFASLFFIPQKDM
jgi:predicted MFS family arabinose efflux permease